jgi:hypothetical protein
MRSAFPRTLQVVAFVAGISLCAKAALACGGRAPLTHAEVWPRTNSQAVSLAANAVVAIDPRIDDPHLQLVAIRDASPTATPFTLLGQGDVGGGLARFWIADPPLSASTLYSVGPAPPAAGAELARFTTSAAATPVATAPVLERLRLWRTQYDKSEIGAGGCVFAEYEGYIDLDYQPAVFEGLVPEDVVHVLSLRRKDGASTEIYVAGRLESRAPFARSLDGVSRIPDGGVPCAQYPTWKPNVIADQEYCLTMTSYGATSAPVVSNEVCAVVVGLDARRPAAADAGAPSDAVAAPDAAAMGEPDASPPAPSTPDAASGAAKDTNKSPTQAPAGGDDGCSYSGGTGPRSNRGGLASLVGLLALVGLRRFRKPFRTTSSVVALVVAAGCSSGSIAGAPSSEGGGTEPATPNAITIFPQDFSTNTGANVPLRVLLGRGGSIVDEQLVQNVAQSVEVRTWPEWELVPSRTTIVKEGEEAPLLDGLGQPRINSRNPRQVDVVLDAKLENRLYAISVDALGFLVGDLWGRTGVRGTAIVSRFRPDSKAIVVGVMAHEKNVLKKLTLSVTMSEPVKLAVEDTQSDVVELVEEIAGMASVQKCRLNGWAAGVLTSSFLAVCEGEFGKPEKATLRISEGLFDSNGIPVAQAFPLKRGSAKSCGGACGVFSAE